MEKNETKALKVYVGASALAKLWSVHRSTVERRLRAAGVYPTWFGRAKRYLLEEVERYVRASSPPSRDRRPLL